MIIKIKINSKIKENNKFNNYNSNILFNINYMLQNTWEQQNKNNSGETIAQSIYLDNSYNNEKLEKNLLPKLISNIPPLKNNKIIRAITAVSFGKIFKLSNGHILKLFNTGNVNPKDDYNWYKENYDKMFAGSADINNLPIYDLGEVDRGDSQRLYYVEMAELIPLDTWLNNTKRQGDAELALEIITVSFLIVPDKYKNHEKMSVQEYINAVIKIIKTKDFANTRYEEAAAGLNITYEPFTLNETKAIITALYKLRKAGREPSDVKPRNLGILPTSNPSNPVVIIFDR